MGKCTSTHACVPCTIGKATECSSYIAKADLLLLSVRESCKMQRARFYDKQFHAQAIWKSVNTAQAASKRRKQHQQWSSSFCTSCVNTFRAMHGLYIGANSACAARENEKRAVEGVACFRQDWDRVRHAVGARLRCLDEEARAIFKQLEQVDCELTNHQAELDEVLALLKLSTQCTSELITRKKIAIVARDFKSAGQLVSEMKDISIKEEQLRSHEIALHASVDACHVLLLTLSSAKEEVCTEYSQVCAESAQSLLLCLNARINYNAHQTQKLWLRVSQARYGTLNLRCSDPLAIDGSMVVCATRLPAEAPRGMASRFGGAAFMVWDLSAELALVRSHQATLDQWLKALLIHGPRCIAESSNKWHAGDVHRSTRHSCVMFVCSANNQAEVNHVQGGGEGINESGLINLSKGRIDAWITRSANELRDGTTSVRPKWMPQLAMHPGTGSALTPEEGKFTKTRVTTQD